MSKRTHIDGPETAPRDTKGRFRPGHPGGPGRPKRATEAQYLDALKATVTLERWQRVIEAALQQAEQGDPKARDWLSRHLLPKEADPAQTLVIDREPQVRLYLPDNARGPATTAH
jgi:hypothetical protein